MGCKKEKIQEPSSCNSYVSSGNLLLLVVGETFECAYEYNLVSTPLKNDSLPISINTDQSSMFSASYWQYQPNEDTLFQSSSQQVQFYTSEIDENDLENLDYYMPYDSTQFQKINGNNNSNLSTAWNQISNLEIVKQYRNARPNSKIGIARVPFSEFNEQLGYAVMSTKNIIFLTK